jgi:acetylornithine deacetylase/succinyl-diaminopimelate desuccinylase-like protein
VSAKFQERVALGEDPRVEAAIESIRASESTTIGDQVRLCEVPAPPFGERARAALVRDLLHAAGLTNVRLDREGNVVGVRRPNVVLAAHLDTVFPEGASVKVI